MRSLKKVFAVAAATVMTMAMGVTAFADKTITFHFQNAENWENVGAWVWEGVGFDTNVTKDAVIVCKDAAHAGDEGGVKLLWPGAKCADEGNGWFKYTATFSDDVCTNGIALLFNNFVADSTLNDTTLQCDLDAMAASGVPTTATAEKKQTGNIVINKKNAILSSGTTPSDVYVFVGEDGKIAPTAEAPASYAPANNNASSGSDNSGSASAGDAAGGSAAGTASGSSSSGTASSSGSTTSNSSVKTGDTVAVSVVAFGVLAAVAFVASRKKVNA